MTSLATLKKSNSFDRLTKELQKSNQKFKEDDRLWQLNVDKAGNGFAVIRFLDAPFVDGEDGLPFVQIWNHGFQGPGGWYIENSLTTLGKPDPVSEYNGKLWKTGLDANKKIASAQKRRLNYISNILVIKDSTNPENEGKVFLCKYGKKIFDKITEKLDPTPEQIEAAKLEGLEVTKFNPFSFWDGANFNLRARKVEGYRNYDKSDFSAQAPVSKDDAAIEKLWKASYSLKEFLDPKNFKTYEQLDKRLNMALGLDGSVALPAKKVAVEAVQVAATAEVVPVETSEDDPMSYFQGLANDES